MVSVGGLLAAPSLRSALRRVAGPDGDREITGVTLIEDLNRLSDASAGSVAILTEAASATAHGYRLDMALRLAGSREVAALVLTDSREDIHSTAATLAERAFVFVLETAANTDLAALVLAIQLELIGGPEAAAARLAAVLVALRDADERNSDGMSVLEAGSTALGHALDRRMPKDDEIGVPIVIDGGVEEMLCAPRQGGHVDTITEAAVHLVAAAVARAEGAARRAEEVPVRSRGELLTEFLLAGPDRADRLLPRLRAAGLAIDSWHAVIRLEIESPSAQSGDDELASFHLRQRLGTVALQAAHSGGGTWHRAQVGSALLLVRIQRRDPRTRGGPELTRAANEILSQIANRIPDVPLVCGVGSVHPGATGLRASAAEAHAAVAAARAARRRNVAVSFDGVGLQRTLIEWYASDTAREMVESLLEPLDRLGGQKAESAIRTLRTYLDSGGSLARTAEQLHLHRNAVSYRLQRIFSALDVDADDPDTRLMLQLACRARLLG